MTLSTGSPSQGDSDTNRGSREARNLCSGYSCSAYPRQPGVPSHHRGQMILVESVLSGTYYGWAQMMLVSLKRQLSLCKRQVNHDCSYGTLLCAFFFEKIPTLRPRIQLPDGGQREPRMCQWGRLLCRGGGGAVGRVFHPEFFAH